MPTARNRPFAYAVEKGMFVFTVRPTLASALDAARARFKSPTIMIGITAWFADGSEEIIPDKSLYSADKSAWLTSDEARQLENALFARLTAREQVTALLRDNWDGNYWETLVLRLAESLFAIVDRELSGMPVEEAGLEKMSLDDYKNLPNTFHLHDGLPVPQQWTLYAQGRRR